VLTIGKYSPKKSNALSKNVVLVGNQKMKLKSTLLITTAQKKGHKMSIQTLDNTVITSTPTYTIACCALLRLAEYSIATFTMFPLSAVHSLEHWFILRAAITALQERRAMQLTTTERLTLFKCLQDMRKPDDVTPGFPPHTKLATDIDYLIQFSYTERG
jgi:hypothetical protein